MVECASYVSGPRLNPTVSERMHEYSTRSLFSVDDVYSSVSATDTNFLSETLPPTHTHLQLENWDISTTFNSFVFFFNK